MKGKDGEMPFSQMHRTNWISDMGADEILILLRRNSLLYPLIRASVMQV